MSGNRLWADIDQRFNALKQRERRMVAIGACCVVALLGYSLGVDPILKQGATLQRNLTQQQGELTTMRAQIATLQSQLRDPNAQNRATLAEVKSGIGKLEAELKAYDTLVVAPARMPKLLQSLLKKHSGLELVALKTLPVTPLLPSRKVEIQPKPALPVDANALKAEPLPPPGGMYRHRMEITVAGSYGELLAYAEELQRISPRPLWSEMRLKVVEYPRSELTFTLYTLSLDPQWLAV